MACPAPTGDPVRTECQQLADEIAAHLAPRAGARTYHEIWLNGEPQEFPAPRARTRRCSSRSTAGTTCRGSSRSPSPCRTTTAPTCWPSASASWPSAARDGKPVGYDLYAGGGQGLTNSKPDTFAATWRSRSGSSTRTKWWRRAEAIAKLYRDHGNRSDRKRARLKYVDPRLGRREVPRRVRPRLLQDAADESRRRDAPITGLDLHLGWQPQAGGNWFLGLSVENGRIKDEGNVTPAKPDCGRS